MELFIMFTFIFGLFTMMSLDDHSDMKLANPLHKAFIIISYFLITVVCLRLLITGYEVYGSHFLSSAILMMLSLPISALSLTLLRMLISKDDLPKPDSHN